MDFDVLLLLIRCRLLMAPRDDYILRGLGNRNDRRDKAIPAARQRLHKARLRGGILENLANLVDRSSQTAIEVDKSVRRPKLLTDLFPCNQLSRAFQEHDEQLKRLRLQAQSYSLFSQLARMQIGFETSQMIADAMWKPGWAQAHRHWRDYQGVRSGSKDISRQAKVTPLV